HRSAMRDGITIETGIDIDDLDGGSGKVSLSGGNRPVPGSFDLVIDASGSRSKLRRHCHRPAEPRPLPYGAFWASLAWRGDGFEENALLQRYESASVMIGVLPIGRPEPQAEKMAAFFWSLKPNDADKVRAAGLDAWKGRVAGLWPDCRAYVDQI